MDEEYSKLVDEARTLALLERFTQTLVAPEYSSTWSSCLDSSDSRTQSTDAQVDIMNPDKEDGSDPAPEKRRRGRKPLRPLDPVRKKTEEKDKYWLRAFRAYMRSFYPSIRDELPQSEQEFWEFHLSPSGKPGKGNQFASYGKNYKSFIFSRPTFVIFFRKWFSEFGEVELSKKCPSHSDLWIVFYEYASKELYCYNETQSEVQLNGESPLLVTTVAPPQDDFRLDLGDEQDVERFIDSMLLDEPWVNK